jgi:hypothetical protein
LSAIGSFATGKAGGIPVGFGPPLAQGAAYLVGAKAIWDKRTFWDRSLVVIVSTMRANRLVALVKIRECQKVNTDACSIGMALGYLDEYYRAGSIPGALSDIGVAATLTNAEAQKKLNP